MKKIVIVIIIVVAFLAAGYYYVVQYGNSSPSPSSTADSQSAGSQSYSLDSTTTSPESLDEINQPNPFGGNGLYPNGGVVIGQISLPQAGFVVIQQDSSNTPGSVIGSSGLLSPGANSQVRVGVNAALSPQSSYFISVYADTNGNGVFDPGTDRVAIDQNGNMMQQIFTQQPSASSTTQSSGQK